MLASVSSAFSIVYHAHWCSELRKRTAWVQNLFWVTVAGRLSTGRALCVVEYGSIKGK